MDYKKIVFDIVSPLVNNQDFKINVKRNGTRVNITLIVDKKDFGRVLGKRGMIANAIREVVGIGGKIDHEIVRFFIENE